MRKPFSKKLLMFDYIIMVILLIVLVSCAILNGLYVFNTTQYLLSNGTELYYTISAPFDITTLSIIVGTWAAQLGVSSGAYYILVRSDHKIEYPIRMIGELPEDIKDKVDYNALIANVLSTTGN